MSLFILFCGKNVRKKPLFKKKKRIEFAAAHAVSEFNTGAVKTAQILVEESGNGLSLNAKKIYEKKDRKRLIQSDIQCQKETKQCRAAKKKNKYQSETKKARLEGPSYGAGKFD